MQVTRLELIKKHREAFKAFAQAGIDPTRHSAYLDIYETRKRLEKPNTRGHVKATAKQFNCTPRTVRNAGKFLNTEI